MIPDTALRAACIAFCKANSLNYEHHKTLVTEQMRQALEAYESARREALPLDQVEQVARAIKDDLMRQADQLGAWVSENVDGYDGDIKPQQLARAALAALSPQQSTALEQNLESMRQTNAALVKRLRDQQSIADWLRAVPVPDVQAVICKTYNEGNETDLQPWEWEYEADAVMQALIARAEGEA